MIPANTSSANRTKLWRTFFWTFQFVLIVQWLSYPYLWVHVSYIIGFSTHNALFFLDIDKLYRWYNTLLSNITSTHSFYHPHAKDRGNTGCHPFRGPLFLNLCKRYSFFTFVNWLQIVAMIWYGRQAKYPEISPWLVHDY